MIVPITPAREANAHYWSAVICLAFAIIDATLFRGVPGATFLAYLNLFFGLASAGIWAVKHYQLS